MRLSPALVVVLLASAVHASEPGLAPFASAGSAQISPPWRVVGVPGGKIPLTSFSIKERNGRQALQVSTAKSYANLVHDVPSRPSIKAMRLSWSWQLNEALPSADLQVRQGDDSPLKVCVLFDMPLEYLGLIERNMLRLARAASSENLPSATLCYVWDEKLEPETLLANAYTARVRLIVVSQGSRQLNQWAMHSRDLSADFLRAFGSETKTVPPILGVLVGGDSDNTGGQSSGLVADLRLDR